MTTEIFGIKYYDVKEAAQKLPVTEQTIKAWCRSGKLKSHKIGRKIYIPVDKLKELCSD